MERECLLKERQKKNRGFIMAIKYEVGDIVTLKKGHPCGENKWEILRTGVDIKLKCVGCDRQVWIPRIDFNKRLKKILEQS